MINKSKELLEILIQEQKLSESEMELIWNATKKGDLEAKLSILKILKEITKSLNPKYIKILLNKIYTNEAQELLNEEIDVSFILNFLSLYTN